MPDLTSTTAPSVDPLKPQGLPAGAQEPSLPSTPEKAPSPPQGILISDLEALKSRLEAAILRAEALLSEVGGSDIEQRLGALEMALGSFAGPTISQIEHDGQGLFLKWWKGIKDEFHAVASAAKAPPSTKT